MPDGQHLLCDACGKEEATVFLTEIRQPGGDMRKTSLCADCAAGLEPFGPPEFREAIERGCVYCGAPADGAHGGPDGPMAICKECSIAVWDFYRAALGLNPATKRDGSDDTLLTTLKEMSREAKAEAGRKMAGFEEYMRGRRKYYSHEAYSLVLDAFRFAMSHPENLATPDNVTAAELLDALRVVAIERFGTGAREQLRAWGVTRCEDIGEIVFRLIETGRLGGRPEDNKEDFSGGYEFGAAFPET